MSVNPNQRLFFSWLSKPEPERNPKTIDDFGQANGIPVSTLYRWRQSLKEAGEGELPKMLRAMEKFALSGKNPKWMELYLRATGQLDAAKPAEDEPIDAGKLTVMLLGVLKDLKTQGIAIRVCPVCNRAIKDETNSWGATS